MIPRATCRLQFHKGFTFADGAALAGYLAALGVSHVYASPIATARPGSMHGYDVIDPTTVNPELGGEPGFRSMAEALHRHGLGIVLDIVPNHLAVSGGDNPWWRDVLARGQASAHAALFDIDWEPADPGLSGKLLAPFLGAPYAQALEGGDIRLEDESPDGLAAVAYGAQRYPIRPEDRDEARAAGVEAFDPRRPGGRSRLHALLERQHFRLAWWRTAGDAINWRRFFEINELAGLRIETEAAFELIHALPLRLYAEGLIDGLRIDHVDGLADPAGYCGKLKARLEALQPGRATLGGDATPYLLVEKILAEGEPLAPDWGVDGTTGYDFMAEVGALLHAFEGETPLTEHWMRISGRTGDFGIEARMARTEVLTRHFAGQLDAAARAFHRLAASSLETRDIATPALRRALTALIAGLGVYRTYATGDGLPEWDRPVLARALARARPLLARHERGLLEQFARWLQGEGGEAAARGEAVRRLQQLSAPVAAKAIEDTAFYRYGRLLSRDEVGSDPGKLAASADETHAAFAARARDVPHALLATATHDHKRGEDARARLAVLSEIPGRWIARAELWRRMNEADGDGVEPADEYMLYQTLLGAWPYGLDPADSAALGSLRERVWAWQEKALREAKLRSSWAEPDPAYEAACRSFLERICAPGTGADFLADLAAFVTEIAPAGALNSLSQTLLRCTAPGVPDLYQGTELWDFSLVDPDNRRPVDYPAIVAGFAPGGGPAGHLSDWRSGAVKQALIARALNARVRRPELFTHGEYLPLAVEGVRRGSVFAFLRRRGDAVALVAAAIRCADAVLGREAPLPPPAWWADTRVLVPGEDARLWEDALSDVPADGAGSYSAAGLFARLPVALRLAAT